MHVIDPLLAAAARMHHVGLVADTRGELDAFCRDAAPHRSSDRPSMW